MSPTTEAKAAAIRAALTLRNPELPELLAMLTSPIKDEREDAKRELRGLVRTGTDILKAAHTAAALASFANRHEP